jgi:hypothetical protein
MTTTSTASRARVFPRLRDSAPRQKIATGLDCRDETPAAFRRADGSSSGRRYDLDVLSLLFLAQQQVE